MREFNKHKIYTVSVEVKSNGRLMVVDQNSPLNGASIVSVRTRRNNGTSRTLMGKTIVNAANFDAAFLILKKDTTTEVVKVPFYIVEQATLQQPAIGFPLFAHDLNFSSCQIEIGEGVTLDVGNYFELTFEYFEAKK